MIKMELIEQNKFRVTVDGPRTTEHMVTVGSSYFEKLTGNRVTPEVLVEKSFEFLLLERESNTSILSTFELPVISRYFPEYEKAISRML